ncbi:putative DNA-dependent RNA polymerase subunit rpb9 [Tupanvirus soda lake]|uniref:DNA-dependent RNA polymerase subunit rpb9 n=2 Tax=Tupanvirus TaxID=2094720 RepID=A0AC62AD02_9VIRU|nr:putative DNA-dependent RNA polymerase subunit rpb9 [Tupanvirus soda lake]QKU35599.1 putative DNA-dependent RNA polymerase subunit rpb9 [Tupanvirus soda lake]
MFFCEKCRFMFNVTKDVKSKQIGGRINEALTNVFNKYFNNEPLQERDLKRIRGKDLLDDERFEDMTKKEQRKMMSWVKSLDRNFFVEEEAPAEPKVGSNAAFFICKYCKNSKPIKPGTLIYSKNYGTDGSSETEDYSYAIYDQTLSRTRNYICKNPKCESHKNDNVREAALTKNAMDQIVYICTSCTTYWVNAV